uniref:Chloride intracellular channel 3 n=1 Tax=Pipistrellus kuhlii TaxID=59472 RepID=A0A7J7RVS2_PIPKU|nr:chloride intracellular channel 3 [Pipistrellus kuhlii]
MAQTAKLQLFVKASEDCESVGHCPSCQRLFMILLLKGVPFMLTTVDTRRSLDVLKDFAPGSQLPILLYNGEAKTDTLQIEEFLEETLGPPAFPSLAPRYRASATAGNDVFGKFSAFIKNPAPGQDDGEGGVLGEGPPGRVRGRPPGRDSPGARTPALYQQLLRALARLDGYLRAPLEDELAREPGLRESRRRFLDGDRLTLADCGLLPKLHIADVSGGRARGAGGQAGGAGGEALTQPGPPPRRRCARTSGGPPSRPSCAASAATWTARCRRRSSSTRARTAPRSWRPTGRWCTPAEPPPLPLRPHSPMKPLTSWAGRPPVGCSDDGQPRATGAETGRAPPIPLPGEDGPDQAPKPVSPGRSGRMARRAGSRAQPEHLRAPSQWVGWPAFLSPTQAAGHPHLSQGLCAGCGVLEAMPCWAGGEGCAPGEDGVPGLGSPGPALHAPPPGSSWAGTGLWPTPRWQGHGGRRRTPLPASQPPEPEPRLTGRPFTERGRGSEAGPRDCPSSHRQTPGSGTPLSAAGSEVIKVDATGRFLTGREEGV